MSETLQDRWTARSLCRLHGHQSRVTVTVRVTVGIAVRVSCPSVHDFERLPEILYSKNCSNASEEV